MKLLFENWRRYLGENINKIYYWQTRGAWKSESQIEFGVTHVPKSIPRQQGRIEEIFEEVRKEKFPGRPSRLNCVYLCENLKGWEGKSFCSYPARGGDETYEVELRGDYSLFKTNSEYWTEAVMRGDEESARRYAEAYWGGADEYTTFLEILVSPPESAIIVGQYFEEEPEEIPGTGDEI